MTWQGTIFMGHEPYESEPRERLAAYLRRTYRDGFAVKRLANAIRCTPKTAENMLDGHWPNSRHWQRIVQIFGRDVLDAVFGPDIDETLTRLRREEAELEELLQQKRARRRQAEGIDAGGSERAETAAHVEPRAFSDKGRAS
jgi:hypothetical protein